MFTYWFAHLSSVFTIQIQACKAGTLSLPVVLWQCRAWCLEKVLNTNLNEWMSDMSEWMSLISQWDLDMSLSNARDQVFSPCSHVYSLLLSIHSLSYQQVLENQMRRTQSLPLKISCIKGGGSSLEGWQSGDKALIKSTNKNIIRYVL